MGKATSADCASNGETISQFQSGEILSIDLSLICTYSNMSRKYTLKGALAAHSHLTQDEKLRILVFPYITQNE